VKSASAAAVHARCRRKSRPCRLFQFSQRYANVRIVGPEQAILYFLYIVERVHKSPPRARVKQPDILHAEVEVVVDPLLHFHHAVAGRQDLDAQERRLHNDPAVRRGTTQNRDIRHPETRGPHLHALGENNEDAPLLLPIAEIPAHQRLQTAMIPFADVSLQQFAVEVLAVGTVAGRKVFAERHDSRGRHGYTRRSSMAEFLLPKAMQLAMACSTWSLRPMSGT